MTVQVTLSAEGATQEEAFQKVARMARLMKGKKIHKKGTALPFKIGDTTIGSVQVEGVPDEPRWRAGHLRPVGPPRAAF